MQTLKEHPGEKRVSSAWLEKKVPWESAPDAEQVTGWELLCAPSSAHQFRRQLLITKWQQLEEAVKDEEPSETWDPCLCLVPLWPRLIPKDFLDHTAGWKGLISTRAVATTDERSNDESNGCKGETREWSAKAKSRPNPSLV